MIREGEPEVTLKYLAQNPHRKLAINGFTEGMCLQPVQKLKRGACGLCRVDRTDKMLV